MLVYLALIIKAAKHNEMGVFPTLHKWLCEYGHVFCLDWIYLHYVNIIKHTNI